MKNFLVLFSMLATLSMSYGQGEGSVFTSTGRGVSTTFASDYQALGINPANLGWDKEFRGKRFALGFLETGFSFSSPLLNNPVLNESRSIPFNFEFKSDATFEEFQELAKDLETGFKLNLDLRLFGIALTTKQGGFAFSVTERYAMSAGLSKDFSEISTFGFGASYFDTLTYKQNGNTYKAVNSPSTYDSLQQDTSVQIVSGASANPKTVPQLFDGTRIKVSWIREFNFGFGRKIFANEKFGIYGGIGIKYLQGMALLDLEAANNDLGGFISYSPSFASNSPGLFSGGSLRFSLPKAAGSGFGVDLGMNVKAFKRVKLGVAVNDIGSITWRENTYSVTADTFLRNFEIAGFHKDSASVQGTSGGATFDSILNNLVNIESGNFERRVSLPTTLRLGASIQFGKFLEVGAEMISPLNNNPGNFTSSVISVGADLKLGPFIFSSGLVTQNNEVLRVPFGIVLSPARGTFELGLSTRDLRSYLQFKKSENPMFSTAFGFLRFRF